MHTHNHLVRSASYLAIGVAGILIVMKIFGVWLTHSLSLQASLFDSCLDGGVSTLNAWAIHQALKPADREHRFGHGKVEALVGVAQAVFIAISAFWLLFEAWRRTETPTPITLNLAVIWIMLLATSLTLGLVLWQHYVIKRTQSLIISSDALHYKADILTNMAAMMGCVGGTWIASIDTVMGALVAFYILWTSWKIGGTALDVLMDRELDDSVRQEIQKLVTRHPAVLGMHDLRTRNAGQKDFAQFHLDLDPTLTVRQAHKITEEVEKILEEHFPRLEVLIHQDPSHECPCYEQNDTLAS